MKLAAIMMGLALIGNAQAQHTDPIRFSYTAKKGAGKTYELRIAATSAKGWHIFSQTQPAEGIAQPTKIIFAKNPVIVLNGVPIEEGNKEKFEDKRIGIVQFQYEKVDFVQNVKMKAVAKTNITGTITYQACTEEMCLPAKTVSFTIPIEP